MKKRSSGSASRAPAVNAASKSRAASASAISGLDLREDGGDLPLGRFDEERRVELGRRVVLGRDPLRTCVRRVELREPLLLERGECLGEAGERAELAHRRGAHGAQHLHGQAEDALEALLHEVGRLLGEEVEVDRELALERETAEADRGAAQAERVARAGRTLAELERDAQVVELVRGGQELARARSTGSGPPEESGRYCSSIATQTASG